MNRRPIFQAIKAFLRTRNVSDKFTAAEVRAIDAAIDEALGQIVVTAPFTHSPPPGQMGGGSISSSPAPTGRGVGPRGIALMHEFEQCKLDAYPDPGSRDGHPWTIGWGSTGPGIHKGVRWTQEQCDARFADDVNNKYGAAVDRLLGNAPTTQSQFDAMVCLTYNIGVGSTNRALPGGFTRSSVLRLHKAGDYKGAARAFLMWNKNDGKVMRGLTRRRLAESDLYDDDGVPS